MVQKRRVDSLFEVSNESIEKIKTKTGEDEDRLGHIEDLLKQWMQCEEYLPENYDKDMARNFIRGSKFSLDVTKKKLQGYFLAKHAFPEIYQDRDPGAQDIQRVFDVINVVRLPKLTENGERICVLSLADATPEAFDLTRSIKLFWMLYDLTLTCQFPVISEILIFDCLNATSTHLVKFLSISFKNSISLLRNAYASRISQVHVINCPAMAEKVISAIRPLLHEKLRDRFVAHKGSESLLKYLQPKLLPSDLGGHLHSLRYYTKQWQEILQDNSDWFRSQENVKIVGTPPKHIDKFTNSEGVEGSFRQLNID